MRWWLRERQYALVNGVYGSGLASAQGSGLETLAPEGGGRIERWGFRVLRAGQGSAIVTIELGRAYGNWYGPRIGLPITFPLAIMQDSEFHADGTGTYLAEGLRTGVLRTFDGGSAELAALLLFWMIWRSR